MSFVLKRYRYRMYPTADQMKFLARSFGCARVVFNDALALRDSAFRDGLPMPTSAELMKVMAESKKTEGREWLNEVSAVVLQQSIRDLDQAYSFFFRRTKAKTRSGKPKFKSRRDSTQSIRITGANFRVEKVSRTRARLHLPKMTPIRMSLSRVLPAAASSVTIILEADGRYYASFVVDAPVRQSRTPVNGSAGIDLGLNHLAVIAYEDGSAEKIDNPRHLRKMLRKLATAQKEHSRRAKGSKNREKSRLKIASVHRRVRQTRLDHHHKLARKFVDENQVIGLESLSIAGLGRTRLARSIHDAGWGLLTRLIEEKAVEAGRTVVRAPRDFPSTRLCSACGVIGEKKPLHIRYWTCECGADHDRDINAAVNIRHVAAGHAETKNDCGGKVSPGLVPAHPGEAVTTRTGCHGSHQEKPRAVRARRMSMVAADFNGDSSV